MTADRDEQRIRSHDEWITIVNSPQVADLLRKQGFEVLAHFMPRIGWSIRDDDDLIEIQRDTSWLRELRKSDAIGDIRKRLGELEAGFEMHKKLQAAQHEENQCKLDAILEETSGNRKLVFRVLVSLLIGAFAIIGYFLVRHGLPGGA